MNATNGFNQKVSRIVRAIDEIAFRNDLLALSAAVETAGGQGCPQAAANTSRQREPAAATGDADASPGLLALERSLRAASSPQGAMLPMVRAITRTASDTASRARPTD